MAIAFDAASSNPATTDPSSATTNTWAHTVGAGSDRLLWVGSMSDSITGVTYNGVSMTKGAERTTYDDTALYYLAAPSTGVNNVIITRSVSGSIWGTAASYTGAAQTGIVDASVTNSGTGLSSITGTLTTVADNCWGITAAFLNNRNTVAGTNSTLRAESGSTGGIFALCDSNAPVTPAGSFSMTTNGSAGSAGALAMVSFPPSASTSITVNPAAQVATFSAPTYTPKTAQILSPSTKSVVASIPTYTTKQGVRVSVNPQSATYTIPAYVVNTSGGLVTPATQSMTFTVPAYSVSSQNIVMPNGQTLTFTLPARTLVTIAHITVTPTTVTLLFSTVGIYKVGAAWRKSSRNSSGLWTKLSRNSN